MSLGTHISELVQENLNFPISLLFDYETSIALNLLSIVNLSQKLKHNLSYDNTELWGMQIRAR